jgi:hypothetical protein
MTFERRFQQLSGSGAKRSQHRFFGVMCSLSDNHLIKSEPFCSSNLSNSVNAPGGLITVVLTMPHSSAFLRRRDTATCEIPNLVAISV